MHSESTPQGQGKPEAGGGSSGSSTLVLHFIEPPAPHIASFQSAYPLLPSVPSDRKEAGRGEGPPGGGGQAGAQEARQENIRGNTARGAPDREGHTCSLPAGSPLEQQQL